MSTMGVLGVELKEFVDSYEKRDRVMSKIMSTVGVNTVYVRFPDEASEEPLFRMLDVELDATVAIGDVSDAIGKMDGVAEVKVRSDHRFFRGPQPPTPF